MKYTFKKIGAALLGLTLAITSLFDKIDEMIIV